jgi:hypothetical protein
VLDRFRDGKEKVLITTNVLARGEPVDWGVYRRIQEIEPYYGMRISKNLKCFSLQWLVSCPFFIFMIPGFDLGLTDYLC